MTYTFFSNSDSEEEDTKYSSFVDLEEFEDDEPQAFDGTEKGSEINSSGRGEEEMEGPVPWDPSESFFAYIQ
jgi:hypothetical protein